jgi:hypothetical protein
MFFMSFVEPLMYQSRYINIPPRFIHTALRIQQKSAVGGLEFLKYPILVNGDRAITATGLKLTYTPARLSGLSWTPRAGAEGDLLQAALPVTSPVPQRDVWKTVCSDVAFLSEATASVRHRVWCILRWIAEHVRYF